MATTYESNIGFFTPITSESVQDAFKEYGGQWIIDAIAIAAKRGRRNWSYVEGILRRWRADGRDDQPAGQDPEGPTGPMTEALIDIFRWRARIEKGNDRQAYNELRGLSTQLHDMGYTTVEAILQLFAKWKKETGHNYPWTAKQFVAFASVALATSEEEDQTHDHHNRGRGSRNGRSANSRKNDDMPDYTAMAREAQAQLQLPDIDLSEILPEGDLG